MIVAYLRKTLNLISFGSHYAATALNYPGLKPCTQGFVVIYSIVMERHETSNQAAMRRGACAAGTTGVASNTLHLSITFSNAFGLRNIK